MTEIPVSPSEIYRIYRRLADDVANQEEQLQRELPVESPAEIDSYLRDVVSDWESSRKSLRTVPTCNVYATRFEHRLEDSVVELLTGLDATVNTLDDVIDTKELSVETRISLTVNAAFSAVLMIENCPRGSRTEIRDVLTEYFTALFQIPLVERQLFQSMQDATTKRERQTAAQHIYAYCARDIDAFARLSAVVHEISSETEQQILQDLRTYHARRLLFKDIRDVERDLVDEDMTPIIQFIRHHDSVAPVEEAIEKLYGSFSYTDSGEAYYGDVLRELEDAPDNLRLTLAENQDLVSSAQL